MANWQAAEPGTVIGDGQGNYQIRVAGQWQPMPKGSLVSDEHGAYHFDSDAIKPPAAGGAAAGGTGTGTATAPVDQIGAANKAAAANEHGPFGDIVDMIRTAPEGIIPALKGIAGQLTDPYGTVKSLADKIHGAIQNPEATATAVGSTLRNATGAQAGPALGAAATGAAVMGGAGEAMGAGEGAATAAEGPFGMRTGASNPIARVGAGSSARPAVTANNQAIADARLGAQVGVPPGTPLGGMVPDTRPGVAPGATRPVLEAAKDPANAVYQRISAALPTGPLSTADQINGVGANDMIVRSPNVQSMIEAQKQRLLTGDMTGDEVVNAERALRYNGFKNQGLPDPENQSLGDAQLQLADAMHQHMVRTLPPNADVSVAQLEDARRNLAQINTLQNHLRGNNIDLQGLARTHRNNSGLFQGDMAQIADFADKNPHVTRLPGDEERFNPSGILQDIADVDLKQPSSYVQPLTGALSRRVLTGGKPPAPPAAGPNLAPLPMNELAPPPGKIGVPPSPQEEMALTQGPGQVTYPTTPRSALADRGAPQTVPPTIARRTENAAPAPSVPENNSDLGAVLSQGVPEGTMTRRTPNPEEHNFEDLGVPTRGITATALRAPGLGDLLSKQRGGPPTDIGPIRQLQNQPRTYGGGKAVPKTAQEAELEAFLKQLQEQPTTYSGIPLGQAFK